MSRQPDPMIYTLFGRYNNKYCHGKYWLDQIFADQLSAILSNKKRLKFLQSPLKQYKSKFYLADYCESLGGEGFASAIVLTA